MEQKAENVAMCKNFGLCDSHLNIEYNSHFLSLKRIKNVNFMNKKNFVSFINR